MAAITGTSGQVGDSFFRRYPLVAFFLLAVGLTWIFMILDALGSHGILPFRVPLPLLLVEGYMPTAAAVIVTGATKGRQGIRGLFRKLLIARLGLGWYALVIFATAGVCVAAIELYNLFGGGQTLPIFSPQSASLSGPALILNVVLLFVVTGLVNGEELAWRGFALPRLQARFNALQSSLILGVIWTAFHLPLFFTTGSSQAGMSFLSFLLSIVGLSVIFTWVYNNTRGSVLLAYILHASQNTWTRVFSVDHSNHAVDWAVAALMLLLAAVVVAVAGSENLSRSTNRLQES